MTTTPFCSTSISSHLARGALGLSALVLAWIGYGIIGWPSLVLVVVALWAFRGCPLCWTVGLWETVARKLRPNSMGTEADKT